MLTKHVLYQLSYNSIAIGNPTTFVIIPNNMIFVNSF